MEKLQVVLLAWAAGMPFLALAAFESVALWALRRRRRRPRPGQLLLYRHIWGRRQ